MSEAINVRDRDQQITVELGGRTRQLIFDMNAFAELEKRYGSVENAMNALQDNKLKDVRIMLWAGLIHDEVAEVDEDTGEPLKYNITPYVVGNWVRDLAMLQEVGGKLGRAIIRNLPGSENMGDAKVTVKAPKGTNTQDNKAKGIANVVPTPEEEAEAAKND